MVDIRIEVKNLKEVQSKMKKDLIATPFNESIKKITLALQREVTVATPVITGRLRSSVTPKVTTEAGISQGIVGTVVNYAPHVEYGQTFPSGKRIEARHVVEGSSMRVRGMGPFAYGLLHMKEKMSVFLQELGLAIQQRWNK